jgi:hypothetical protein
MMFAVMEARFPWLSAKCYRIGEERGAHVALGGQSLPTSVTGHDGPLPGNDFPQEMNVIGKWLAGVLTILHACWRWSARS